MARILLLLAIVSTLAVSNAFAEGPKFSFDARYDVIAPVGRGALRQASDGKGHMLHESTAFNGNKDISILDFVNKVMTVLVVRDKVAIQTKMTGREGNLIYDEESAKKPGAKALGAKVIEGHPCHGWEVTHGSSAEEKWIGDDTKYLVYSESTVGTVKVTTRLKQWSDKAPVASEFKIPSEYKMAALPGGGGQDSSNQPGMEIVTQCLQENKPDEAVEQLNKMIDKNPKDKTLLVVRGGILYRSLQKRDEALKDFNRAIELDPSWFQAYKRRGEYFAFFGQQAEAMDDFNKCLSLAPEYGDVYVWRASVYAQQKYKEAQEDLDKAEKYHARNVGMLTKLKAICRAATQQGGSP